MYLDSKIQNLGALGCQAIIYIYKKVNTFIQTKVYRNSKSVVKVKEIHHGSSTLQSMPVSYRQT